MFSSRPPTAHDHQPLPVVCENLQRLSFRTKREFERYLKDYAAAQARNRGMYAAQGENQRKAWDTEGPQTYQRREGVGDHRERGMGSPFLRARVHLRKAEREQETSQGGTRDRASIQIKERVMGPDEDWEESHKHINVATSRENRTRYKRDENEDVRERFERSQRLAQRRARRRAKKEIINPSIPTKVITSEYQKPLRKHKRDEEMESDNDFDRGTRKKKKRKSKVALGISLMEAFTAKNVGHGRLTLPPPSHAGLFSKGRASMKTEVKKSGKENRRPANIFSEFEFLNRPNTFRGRDDERSSTSQSSGGRESSFSVLSLTKIRYQASKGGKCPSERQLKEASLQPDLPKNRRARKSPSRSDTDSERHSASWGLGSVLPSDDESVQVAPLRPSREPRQPTITVEEVIDPGTNSRVPPRQSLPEVVIRVVPSQWGFDEADGVVGRFQPQVPAKQTTLQDTKDPCKGDPHCQDTTAFRSPSSPVRVPSPDPLLPSPPRIPDANEQTLQVSREEQSILQTEFPASLAGDPHQEAYPLETATGDPRIARDSLSNVRALLEEHMTNDSAMGDPLHPANSGLTVAHFIDEYLGTEDDFDIPIDDYLDFRVDPLTSLDAQSPQETHDVRQVSSAPALQWDGQYCGQFNGQNVDGFAWCDTLDWEDATGWNDNTRIEGGPYAGPISHSQDYGKVACDDGLCHDGFTSAGVYHDVDCQMLSTNMLVDEQESPNEGQYEGPIGYEGQGSEEEDVMLEFSEGRTLLMGMGDGMLAEKPSKEPGFEKLHSQPYRLQFGQSVNDIEVMVGKNLGNLWKQ